MANNGFKCQTCRDRGKIIAEAQSVPRFMHEIPCPDCHSELYNRPRREDLWCRVETLERQIEELQRHVESAMRLPPGTGINFITKEA